MKAGKTCHIFVELYAGKVIHHNKLQWHSFNFTWYPIYELAFRVALWLTLALKAVTIIFRAPKLRYHLGGSSLTGHPFERHPLNFPCMLVRFLVQVKCVILNDCLVIRIRSSRQFAIYWTAWVVRTVVRTSCEPADLWSIFICSHDGLCLIQKFELVAICWAIQFIYS